MSIIIACYNACDVEALSMSWTCWQHAAPVQLLLRTGDLHISKCERWKQVLQHSSQLSCGVCAWQLTATDSNSMPRAICLCDMAGLCCAVVRLPQVLVKLSFECDVVVHARVPSGGVEHHSFTSGQTCWVLRLRGVDQQQLRPCCETDAQGRLE